MNAFPIGGAVVLAAALGACATPQPASPGARPADQVRQQELKQMEAQGQRNDIDRVPGLPRPAQ